METESGKKYPVGRMKGKANESGHAGGHGEKDLCIAVTIPSSVDWNDYEREIDAVRDGSHCMNFKVPFLPAKERRDRIGRCYIVHRGKVKGWQRVCGFVEGKRFTCTTTGKEWEGNFIQRTGEFHRLGKDVGMKGFRGWRWFDPVDAGCEEGTGESLSETSGGNDQEKGTRVRLRPREGQAAHGNGQAGKD